MCSLKYLTFRRGEFSKDQYRGRDCLKRRGGHGQFADLKGGLGKKERGGIFEGEGLILDAHYEAHGKKLDSLKYQPIK